MQRGKKAFRLQLLSGLLCLVAMLVAACGTTGSTATGKPQAASADKQVFRYPIYTQQDFGSLDPALVQGAQDSTAIQTIFTGLVQFNDSGKVVDQLAASHTVSADGLTYTFKLKPNLKFSDGTPLTSADIAYSVNRVADPATKSQVTNYLKLLKDIDKITAGSIKTLIGDSILTPDANTIQFVISSPAAYFLETMTYPTWYPVEKKLIDAYGTNWTDHLTAGGGDGPFKVSSYSHTTGLVLVPNSNYYGAKPQIQRLEFPLSGDTATTEKAYKSGQYDESPVPAADYPTDKSRKDFRATPQLTEYFATMNYQAKPFDNVKIRQAFALAIKKQLITDTVLYGAQTPTYHIVPQGMYGYDSSLQGPAGVNSANGDQAKAKELLAEGLKEEGMTSLPTITYSYYSGSTTAKNVAEALINQWTSVLGANIKTSVVDFNTLIQQETNTIGHPGPLQIWFIGWQADYTDPQDWLSLFFNKAADQNNINYGQNSSTAASEQVAVQTELTAADIEKDPAKRLSMYNDAEQKITNDVAWIPLYQSRTLTLLSPKVQGFVDDALGIIAPDDWGNIYISQ